MQTQTGATQFSTMPGVSNDEHNLMGGEGNFEFDVLQQVHNNIMMNFGETASRYGGDRSILAEKLV